AEVTTVLFDDQYEKIADAVNLKDASELTSAEYYARGTTALLDAVGRTIMDTAGKMERENICPAKRRVLIMIMTDGYENASREYTKADVKALVEATTNDYKWNYIFMGANIDSVAEAGSIGIKARHAANYSHNSKGVDRSFEQMHDAASAVRESGAVSDDWNK
ncbi:MAG: VWA domain-containing protein, partial [Selenomonadaceae bacterium]|nr:VWA domain-containing protein [Selenomonadaceae bacterium]